MSTAIERIVAAYVKIGNRQELEDLLAHRQKMVVDLSGRSGYDFAVPLVEIQKEVQAITAGLALFDSP